MESEAEPTTPTYYKVLREDGTGKYSNSSWELPKGKRPGKWMPKIDRIIVCQSGYHLTTDEHLLSWLSGVVYEAEGRGQQVDSNNKVVFSQARLLKKLVIWTPQLSTFLACDYAEHVLHIFEDKRKGDNRPRDAIELARKWASGGEVSRDELYHARKASRAAAYAADAADAADAAAYTAYTAYAADAAAAAAAAAADAAAAAYAAAAAADAADAAAAAADAAARKTEKQYQVTRLMEYVNQSVDLEQWK